jgi:signal recognition particle GTPase
MVNERIVYFRKIYPEGSIITELLSSTNGVHAFKAMAINNGNVLATGHASEIEGSSNVNKTSALENAETSAVGRALGILGIGIESSIASAEEVSNAVEQQDNTEENKPSTKKELDDAKQTLREAHEMGSLTKTYHELPNIQKTELRDFANELRAS